MNNQILKNWLSMFIALSTSVPLLAQNFFDSQLVKQSEVYSISIDDGISFPFPTSMASEMVVSFTPTSRNVIIAPGSGDPGIQTSNPLLVDNCLCNLDGDSQLDGCFGLSFFSLRDLGEWIITVPPIIQIDPSFCVGGPCAFSCDQTGASFTNNTFSFIITVFNDPPEANITFSPSPRWNETVELDANSFDPDAGSVSHMWSITNKPASSSATLSNPDTQTPTIEFLSDNDIGNWTFRVQVDDDEGERKTFTRTFEVPNVEPDISIQGVTTVDALELVSLSAVNAGVSNPGRDVDGGNLTFEWEVLSAPINGSYGVGDTWNTREISFTTTEDDITTVDGIDDGLYTFQVTATDNEGDDDVQQVDVRVHNLPPEIDLIGDEEIDVGHELWVETDIVTDEDGGDLEFSWDLIQTPNSSSLGPQSDYSTNSVLSINTNEDDAGTWIVELHATDNEGETVSELFTILVDGLPIAIINGPEQIGSLSFPLILDGSDSEDADSPCQSPDYCHTTSFPPVSISQGIVSYEWYLIDYPYEYQTEYYPARVDELFGISGNGPSIILDFGSLRPGDWEFELLVGDAEGNEVSEYFTVTIVDEEGKPFVFLNPPLNHLTDLTGIISNDLTISGVESFDLDNILTGDAMVPGVGIEEYSWSYVSVPPGCPSPPALPSGNSTSIFNLFNSGDVVSAECLGTYVVDLTVTDDDAIPKTESGQTSVTIYNCPSDLCIIHPSTAIPEFVEFTQNTDIIIYYYLNSTVYDLPIFNAGLIAQLEIFHESNLTTPVYTDYDPNTLGSDKGSILAFHWDGFYDTNEFPLSGNYHVNITLLDAQFGNTLHVTTELDAIRIEVVKPVIAPTTTQYVDYDDLSIGLYPVVIDYSFLGGQPDLLVWRVFDESSTVIMEETISPPFTNSINWNGIDGSNTTIPPGFYQIELEALRGSDILGTSELYGFFVYEMEITSPSGGLSNIAPGLHILVNSDDDDQNNIVDSNEVVATENDLVQFDLSILPPNIPGEFRLSATNSSYLKVWTTSNKAAEINLPSNTVMPADTPPSTIYVEGREAGESTISLSFTTIEGDILNDQEAILTFVEVQIMTDADNNFTIDGADNAQLFVEVGLWDYAFRQAADAFGPIGTIYNEQDDVRIAAGGDPDNLVGRDSKRFYYQVKDPSANTDPAVAEEIPLTNFDFHTLNANGTIDDKPPVDTTMTLEETGLNTGIFLSKAVMLVSDTIDRNQMTNTGTALHPGLAKHDEVNHRIRHVSTLDGSVESKYRPTGPGGPEFILNYPVFQRTPENRRTLTVRVFNFADPNNLLIRGLNDTDINNLSQVIKERYVPAGIRVVTAYNKATDSLDLPLGSAINLNTVGTFTLAGASHNTLTPSADQAALIGMVRAVDPPTAANANTIYLLYIGNFSSGDRGQSFPDGWIPAGSVAKNFVFVAGGAASIDYSAAHEVGHMVTNQTLTAGEANGTTAGWDGGGHYGGPQATFNLMRNGTIATNPRNTSNTKRWWNDSAIHVIKQIDRIRTTRFLTNP